MRKNWQAAVTVLGLVGATVLASPAPAAEVAQTMAALEARLKPGTTVDVVDRQGKVLRGDFVRADTEGVLITGFGTAEGHRIPAADLATVTRHGDSLKNGALIGAGVGLIGAISAFADPNAVECGSRDRGCQFIFAAASLGIYTGAGVLWDRAVKGREVVYRAPADRAAWSVVPYPVRQGAGVQFALRF